MIYRTDAETGKIYQPLDWTLYSADHRPVPLGSEEDLRAYLKNHPDEDFYLVPAPYLNREIQGETAAALDRQGTNVRVGIVRYDSADGKIFTHRGLKVAYSDRAKQWKTGLEMLRQATAQLELVLGSSVESVTATWDRVADGQGRSLYRLTLSDWSGEITTSVFTPDELQSATNMRIRLYRLWGDVLRRRSDMQHRKVEQLVSGQIVDGN